jgi:hypothetical protein
MGFHDSVAPEPQRTRKQISHFLLQQSLFCYPRSITVVCPFYPLLLRSYVWLSAFATTFTFLFDSFMSAMGRRWAAEDYQRTVAENG